MSTDNLRGTDQSNASRIGKQIARSRRRIGVTQAVVCRRTGLDPSYLSRLEAGRIQPTVVTVLRIAKALGASLDELLGILPLETRPNACPVSPNGECLLEAGDIKTSATASTRALTLKQLSLVRRFTAVVEKSDQEVAGALNVLLHELERACRSR